jgi:uncharacterized protein YceK
MALTQENKGAKMKKLILSVAAAAFLFSGCAQMNSNMSSTQGASAQELIKTAYVKYNQAHQEGVAWKETKSLIVDAEAMLKKSDDKKAIALANKAIYQADTAMAESREYDKTWRQTVPQ